MISCTEFIPAYSELFKYLEENYGRSEVDCYWSTLFNPNDGNIPLIDFVNKEGIKGCFTYWSHSLNEEAADFTMYLNEKAGWFMIDMHRCPSKGKLLCLQEEIGVPPYRDYCLHCDHYRQSIEKVGLKYIYNFCGTDRAACRLLVYDDKVFDGRVIIDDSTIVMDRKAADNEYFHQDFHRALNRGLTYLGEKFGEEDVIKYLTKYTDTVLNPVIESAKKNGVSAIEDYLRNAYKKEKAEDALEITHDGGVMNVTVKYCPATRYLKSIGKEISKWHRNTKETILNVIAERAGLSFKMLSYDEETGASKYCFK